MAGCMYHGNPCRCFTGYGGVEPTAVESREEMRAMGNGKDEPAPCPSCDALRSQLAEARRESTEWIDSLRADVRHALEERDEAREETRRLTLGRDRALNLAQDRGFYFEESLDDLLALRAFLDEVRPVLLWVCKTPGFGKWEDLARTLIGRWPK